MHLQRFYLLFTLFLQSFSILYLLFQFLAGLNVFFFELFNGQLHDIFIFSSVLMFLLAFAEYLERTGLIESLKLLGPLPFVLGVILKHFDNFSGIRNFPSLNQTTEIILPVTEHLIFILYFPDDLPLNFFLSLQLLSLFLNGPNKFPLPLALFAMCFNIKSFDNSTR